MRNNKIVRKSSKATVPGTGSDRMYKRKMASIFAPVLFKRHVEYNYTSCAFCRYLRKSHCHINCFKCSKNAYERCERLLPGIVSCSFIRSRLKESTSTPWLFKLPCARFSRLSKWQYLRNFSKGDFDTKIWNLEIVEGLFGGLANGNTPCHICASVGTDIFNNCSSNTNCYEYKPCNEILNRLYKWYETEKPGSTSEHGTTAAQD